LGEKKRIPLFVPTPLYFGDWPKWAVSLAYIADKNRSAEGMGSRMWEVKGVQNKDQQCGTADRTTFLRADYLAMLKPAGAPVSGSM
jgi:hypothetical protein